MFETAFEALPMTMHEGPSHSERMTPGRGNDDAAIVARLRRGDEQVFVQLIDQHHPALVRMALAYVGDYESAEDVAQDTWLCLLQSIGRFEGRSTLRTWIFGILINRAKQRAQRDGRTVAFSSLGHGEDAEQASVEPWRFRKEGELWAGGWKYPPLRVDNDPEVHVLSSEMRATIERAVMKLPVNQRQVFWLRDVEGWTAAEVCDLLQVSEGNQRVLLHRARAQVRGALEQYWEGMVRSRERDE